MQIQSNLAHLSLPWMGHHWHDRLCIDCKSIVPSGTLFPKSSLLWSFCLQLLNGCLVSACVNSTLGTSYQCTVFQHGHLELMLFHSKKGSLFFLELSLSSASKNPFLCILFFSTSLSMRLLHLPSNNKQICEWLSVCVFLVLVHFFK